MALCRAAVLAGGGWSRLPVLKHRPNTACGGKNRKRLRRVAVVCLSGVWLGVTFSIDGLLKNFSI